MEATRIYGIFKRFRILHLNKIRTTFLRHIVTFTMSWMEERLSYTISAFWFWIISLIAFFTLKCPLALVHIYENFKCRYWCKNHHILWCIHMKIVLENAFLTNLNHIRYHWNFIGAKNLDLLSILIYFNGWVLVSR